MSGPKVVRVVTREELEAICRRQLAVVDHAMDQLHRILDKYELQEPALKEALSARRKELAAALKGGQFSVLQKQAPAFVEYLRSESARLELQAIAAIEAARSRRRRLSDAARSVANALVASGAEPSSELRAVIEKTLTADEADLKRYQHVVDSAFKLLTKEEKLTKVIKQQEALAARLGAGEKVETLAAWMAQHGAPSEAQTSRLDKVLAELEHFGDAAIVDDFGKRAAIIAVEKSPDHRRLLTDSLVLDASDALRRLKEEAGLRAQLQELAASLSTYASDETARVGRDIARSLAKPGMPDKALIEVASVAIEQAQKVLAATARRRAVLEGLATLGYEVRENMGTAWARDGRLVVRKPGSTDYGVELAAPADAARLQVRLVGAQSPVEPRGPERDRDQETIWCSEFGQLQKLVASAGGDLHIERAKEVGAELVKTIAFEDAVAGSQADARQLRERRL